MAKVTIEHIARIEASIPTGATVAVMKTALNSTICTDEPLCDVVVATSRRSLQSSLVHGRNLVTAAFTVTRSLDDTSDLSLGPPTIDTAAVATSLGLPSSTVITSTTSVQSVSASVTVVNQGSSSSPAAQAALSSAASLPSVLAGSLGVSTASISFVSSPVLIQPPMPPPRSPSPPLLSSNTASASPPQPWIQSTLPPAVGASPSSPSALDSRSDADTMEASGPDADGASLAGVGVGVGVVIFVAALIAWWYCKRLPAKALRYSSTFDESSVELHDVMGSPCLCETLELEPEVCVKDETGGEHDGNGYQRTVLSCVRPCSRRDTHEKDRIYSRRSQIWSVWTTQIPAPSSVLDALDAK